MATTASIIEQTTNQGAVLEKRTIEVITELGYKAFIFLVIFALFLVNLVAVSISLQCNQGRSLSFKLASALFAFMFGFLYIMVNYLSYRVKMQHNPCMLYANNPFPLFDTGLEFNENKKLSY